MEFGRGILCITLGMILVTPLWGGDEADSTHYVETRTIDGFSIGVTDELGSTNSAATRRLCFSVWTTNNLAHTYSLRVGYPTDPEYAFEVEMFDVYGSPIPKTQAGESVGAKFRDFDPKRATVHSTGPSMRWRDIVLSTVDVCGKDKPAQLIWLFRPSELFNISKAGRYNLHIQLQIITLQPASGKLIRFPPIDYPVVQESGAPK